MSSQRFDIVVIGGGIVGLATAMQLTASFPRLKLLLVEKEPTVGQHQSSHNSGVIHSGIYYKPGSLKAKLCVEGANAIIQFCRHHNIRHRITGKIIVATEERELQYLRTLLERAKANGLSGVRELGPEQIRELEPHCKGIRGLHVPSAGIADYPAVCAKYAELITAQGGWVSTNTKVTKINKQGSDTVIETTQGSFTSQYVLNCAGLHSDRVSRIAGQKPDMQILPFRGEYYDLVPEKEHLVKSLIYPVPDPQFPFLGVHFTQRVHGGVDAGPNAVLALKREGYRWADISVKDTAEIFGYMGFWRMAAKYWQTGLTEVHRSLQKKVFVRALQRLVPEITSSDLVTSGSGVRAQAVRPDGSLVDDFQFVRVGNVLNICNVPSPAATASLAIGREIVSMAAKEFVFDKYKN